MLIFEASELPTMVKGKGNQMVSIPASQAASGEDKVAWLRVLPENASVKHCILVNVNSRCR